MPEEVTFQNDPVDPSAEFAKQQNHFFVADAVAELDPGAGRGELSWRPGRSCSGCPTTR
jgi:alpha-D-xyloside xylohydrolase